jgi:hypothetical protein
MIEKYDIDALYFPSTSIGCFVVLYNAVGESCMTFLYFFLILFTYIREVKKMYRFNGGTSFMANGYVIWEDGLGKYPKPNWFAVK